MKDPKFFICKHCGNLVTKIHDSGVPMICCGERMSEIIPGSMDASLEKHVPVVTVAGDIVVVEIGSAPHPMTAEHLIEWVYLLTENGFQLKYLAAGDEPKLSFSLLGDKAVTAYAYCNLHGLWKKDA